MRALVRLALGALMVVAGIGHFVAHDSFLQQTPRWLPARSPVIWGTGVLEIGLGLGLVVLPQHRRKVGWALAVFLVAVFPGNIYQAVAGTDAFGLRTPTARWTRLVFQPLLVAAALWSTGGWPPRGQARRRSETPKGRR